MAPAKSKKWAAESLVSETERKKSRAMSSTDARKAPKVHPMIVSARKRKPKPYEGSHIDPKKPTLGYEKGKGVVKNKTKTWNY